MLHGWHSEVLTLVMTAWLTCCTCSLQVLGVEDIELLLGKRPFVSEAMRNIDMYRQGFQKKIEGEGAEGAEKAAAEGDEEGDDEAAQQRFFDPNIIVAT